MCSISKEAGVNGGEARTSSSATLSSSSTLWAGSTLAILLALISRSSLAMNLFGVVIVGVFLFLVSVVAFVNYYIRGMRKASVSGPQTVSLVKKTPPSKESLDDLDRIVCDEGLTALWKREIQDQGKPFRLLLTGVTGYVGRAFLYQLLREIQIAETNSGKKLAHKVYVMARGKARKNLTAADRLQTIRDDSMFCGLTEQWNAVVVPVESGDLQDAQCGMSDETLKVLADAQLTHVVHCAADVNFNRPIADSAAINIAPALEMQRMAQAWPSCTRFVHCSTAFVNPGCGSMEEPMREALFPLGKYDPQELYDSMRGDQKLALQAKAEFGFANNYVLTKCVGEHLVARNNQSNRVELRIVRPAVVGPSWLLPHQGWNGDKPSTVTGVFLLWGCRVLRVAPSTNEASPVIPVDVVAAGIIHAVVAPTAKKQDNAEFPLRIRNLIWSHKSPKPFMTGTEMCRDCMNTALIYGHFTATETALCLFLMDVTQKFPFLFGFIHFIFNKCPLYLLQFVCWSVKTLGIKSVLEQVPVIKLFKFQDMCVLYKPYMGRAFKFESSVNVPPTLDIPQYGSGFITATHGFCASMFPGSMLALDVLDILPKGRLDFWWSMTQPAMDMKNRLVGYLTGQIVRTITASTMVDFTSMEEVFITMLKLEKSLVEQPKKKHAVILALSAASPLDPVLVKYVSFYFDTMGLDVPTVISSSEWKLGGDKLTRRLKDDASRFDRHYTVAALQDGEHGGTLETLVEALQNGVVDDVTVVPLSMTCKTSSNKTSENALQRGSSADVSLSALLSLYWSVCILGTARKTMGDVHVAFGVPVTLSDGKKDISQYVVDELNRVGKANTSTKQEKSS